MAIKKVIYEGEEIDCNVSVNYIAVIVSIILTIGAPLYLVFIGFPYVAVGVFVLALFGVIIKGNSAFMNITPVKNNKMNETKRKR